MKELSSVMERSNVENLSSQSTDTLNKCFPAVLEFSSVPLYTSPFRGLASETLENFFLSSPQTYVDWITHINQLEGLAQEEALAEIHQASPYGGRNIAAGYVRGWSLFFGKLEEVVRNDPLFDVVFNLVKSLTLLGEKRLMNLFLLLKYAVREVPGEIIEFGSFRCGTAIFLACVARELGINKKIYALDTFEGIPDADEHLDLYESGDFKEVSFSHLKKIIKQLHLDNIVLVKGRFQDTFPRISSTLSSVSLVHIDAITYSSVKYAIDAVMPHVNPRGGYLIVDDVSCSAYMGTLQAVEEMVAKYDLNAEQTSPHFVYRRFKS